MGIASQTVTRDGGSIVCTDGSSWSITRAQVLAIYNSKSGTQSSRISQTITDILSQIQTSLGVANVDVNVLAVAFDAATGDLKHIARYLTTAERDTEAAAL
jgi:hypothetical protein